MLHAIERPNMASQVDADAVADAAHLLRTLSAELSIKHLSTIAHENAQLKKELQNVVAENSGAMRSIQRLRGEVDSTETRLKESDAKLQELRKEKARLSAGLEAAQNALEASKKEVKNLEAKFMKDQDSIAKELNDKALELERLQGFIFELKPVSDSKTRKDM
jgi:chromosome segregation ATPase